MEEVTLEEHTLEELREVLRDFEGDLDEKAKRRFFPQVYSICKTKSVQKIVTYFLFLLNQDVFHYDYEQDYTYLMSIFPCIALLLRDRSVPRDLIASGILAAKEAIVTELRKKPGEIKKNHPNYLLLKDLISNLDGLQLAFLSDLQSAYHGDKYPIVSYLFFKKKNFAYIKTAIDEIPYLVTMVDQKGVSLLEHVVDHYLEALQNYGRKRTVCELEQIAYYDYLTTLMLDGTPLQNEEYQKLKGMQLQKLKLFAKDLKERNYPREVLDRMISGIDSMYEKLVSPKKPKLSYDELCYQYDIRDHFSMKVEREVRKYDRPIAIENEKKRRIISAQEETILTIDGIGAKELDDGLSIRKLENGNYLLSVHIADPLGYLPMFGEILTEAEKRGSSLYLNQQMIPMLPFSLACHRMSLRAGRFRYARSFSIEITPLGQISIDHFTMERTLIQPYDNLSYVDANQILEKGQNPDKKIEQSMELLSLVMSKVQGRMALSDLYTQLIDSNFVPRKETAQSFSITPAERIVSTAMLLVNQMVALTFAKQGLPFLYRNHEMSKEDIVRFQKLERNLKPNSSSWNQTIHKMENLFDRSYYGVENKGHWALGFSAYAHVSSPLRRYADILASYSMDQLFFGSVSTEKVEQVEKTLVRGCRRLNSRMTLLHDFTERVSK